MCSLYNHACDSKEGQEHTFSKLMCKIHEASKGDKEIFFANEFADLEVLVQVNEWVSTSYDNLEFHAVLRCDLTSLTLEIAGALDAIRLDVVQTTALMELLYQ